MELQGDATILKMKQRWVLYKCTHHTHILSFLMKTCSSISNVMGTFIFSIFFFFFGGEAVQSNNQCEEGLNMNKGRGRVMKTEGKLTFFGKIIKYEWDYSIEGYLLLFMSWGNFAFLFFFAVR